MAAAGNRALLVPGSAALAALERDFALLDAGRLRADDFGLRLADARVAVTPDAARLLRQHASGAGVSVHALLRALTAGDGDAAAAAHAAAHAAGGFGAASEAHRERATAYSTARASNIHDHGPALTARACRNELDARLEAASGSGAPVFSNKAPQRTPQLQAESGAGALIRGETPAGAARSPPRAPHSHAYEPHMQRSALVVQDPRDHARPEFPAPHYRASADAATFTTGSGGSTFFRPHVAPDQRVHGATLQQLAGGCDSALERRNVDFGASGGGAGGGAGSRGAHFGDVPHDASFGGMAVSPRRQWELAESVMAPRAELQSVEQRRALAALGSVGVTDGSAVQARQIAAQLGRKPLHESRMTRAAAPFALG